ncbi:MAG: ATP-binding protein [Bryobacteraceae bacterium]
MAIAQETLNRIGQPEDQFLEYKAVLPPAATIAQLISALANTKGGAIVMGVSEQGSGISINGLSDEFRAVEITRKAIDLLTPKPPVNYDQVDHGGKRLFVIEVPQSATEVLFGGKAFIRAGDRTILKQAAPTKPLSEPGIEKLRKALADERKACTEARAKLLDHYGSVLRILDDLSHLLYPKGASVPTDIVEGKILIRILFASCADTFETFMSDLLYQIYLAKHETLISPATVKVEDVLKRADMDEFITWYAKEKIKKLQRGSVKGFIAENQTIKNLNAFDDMRIAEIEKILQIRHLFTHQNGIVDDRFRHYFPATNANDEYPMTLDEFLRSLEYLADSAEGVDNKARNAFSLSLYS